MDHEVPKPMGGAQNKAAEDARIAAMTAQERPDCMLEMNARHWKSLGLWGDRIERVIRVIRLSET